MRVILIGDGKLAYFLGKKFVAQRHRVTIINAHPTEAEEFSHQIKATAIACVTQFYLFPYFCQNGMLPRQLRQISMFVFLYLGIYLTGSAIIAAYGYSLPESLFEYASALSTVGLSVGVTAPDAPIALLWTEIAGMFLGRLEFFPVFVGLIRIYQDLA